MNTLNKYYTKIRLFTKIEEEFLKKYIPSKPGIIRSHDGETCGKHEGLSYYTIGQRKGLRIGGGYGNNRDPWFVSDKDFENNILIVSQGIEHPSLYHKRLKANSLHWIEGCAPKSVENLTAKIRYRQQDQECVIIHINNDTCDIEFAKPQFAIAPGQSIVFYDGNICLGGGIILERS